jgi:hypothetical protein
VHLNKVRHKILSAAGEYCQRIFSPDGMSGILVGPGTSVEKNEEERL